MHILNKQELKKVIGGPTNVDYATGIDGLFNVAEEWGHTEELTSILANLPEGVEGVEILAYGSNPESDTIEGFKLIRVAFSDNSQLLMTDRKIMRVG